MNAFLLISLNDSKEEELLEDLSEYPEVEEGYIIFGEWDIILKLKAESNEAASKFVRDNVRSLSVVKLTSTLIVAV